MKEKIGIGIITCNRPKFLSELLNTIPDIGEIVIVNDGKQVDNSINIPAKCNMIQHKMNLGIARSKNDALKYLLEKQCKHIFIVEDDIAFTFPNVFEKYILASERSKIYHFNYAFHGPSNKSDEGIPIPRKGIKYSGNVHITLFHNLVGALSYFRDEVLQKVGLMDTFYKNVLEHVDHTYRISLAGYHPPFHWFCDIEGSESMIKELDPCLKKSINSENIIPINFRARIFGIYFMAKYGCRPHKIKDASEYEVMSYLKSRSLDMNVL